MIAWLIALAVYGAVMTGYSLYLIVERRRETSLILRVFDAWNDQAHKTLTYQREILRSITELEAEMRKRTGVEEANQ